MSMSVTLKGIPDDVYARLKATAEAHHRSLNNEVIHMLESALMVHRVPAHERIARARALRAELKSGAFKAKDIDTLKRQGRE